MYRVFLWITLSVTSAERHCVTVCLTFVMQGLPNKTSKLHLSGKASPPAGVRLASFNATLLSQRVTEKTISLARKSAFSFISILDDLGLLP